MMCFFVLHLVVGNATHISNHYGDEAHESHLEELVLFQLVFVLKENTVNFVIVA